MNVSSPVQELPFELSLRELWQLYVAKSTHLDRVHTEPPLPDPATLCVADDEVLVCADDEQTAIFKLLRKRMELLSAERPLN